MTKPTPTELSVTDTELGLASAAPTKGPVRGLLFSIRAVISHRELLGLLVNREIKARYKDSSLGLLWSLLRPLTQLLIYYVAIGKFLGAERQIPDFAIFVFTGLTAWGLFSEILSSATSSIVTNAGLIKKVYIPREVFPLAAVGSAGFNFLIQLAILLIATIVSGNAPFTPAVAFLPLALLVLLLFSFSLGLLLSAINVYLRDFQHLVEVMLLVLFWASPIVYSYSFVHNELQGNWIEQLYLANPVTLIVMGFQKALWISGGADQTIPSADLALRLGITGAVSLLLLWFAQRVFARLEGNFAQEL